MNLRSLALAFAGVASLVSSQSLLTTMAGGNQHHGNMFDIVALNSVTITSFDVNPVAAGLVDYAIYTHTGTMVGTDFNAGAWTLVGTATGVNGTPFVPTPVPIAVNVTIPTGATQAFYVTSTLPASYLNYTNGTALGAVYAQDASIQFLQGYGIFYPFAGTFNPRVWNGVIHYTPANANPNYQVNQNGSSLDINGVQGSGFVASSVQVCVNQTFNANANSLNGVGLGWDVLISPIPLIPLNQGAISTAGGQILNINVAAFSFFLGGSFTTPFAPFSLPASFGVPIDLYLQMANIDPTHVDLVALSQPNQLHVVASGTAAMPTADDSFTTVNLSGQPFCGPGSIPFFGTSYTQMQVCSNGRVMFGAGSTSYTPSAALGITDSPWIGTWGDLNPSIAGSGQITATQPAAGMVRIDYNGVYLFATTTPLTFAVQFDAGTGLVTLDSYNPGVAAAIFMLGMSRGNGIATDPGQAVYSAGILNLAPPSNGMIYKLAAANAMFPTGMTRIDFVPNMSGTYDWIGS